MKVTLIMKHESDRVDFLSGKYEGGGEQGEQ